MTEQTSATPPTPKTRKPRAPRVKKSPVADQGTSNPTPEVTETQETQMITLQPLTKISECPDEFRTELTNMLVALNNMFKHQLTKRERVIVGYTEAEREKFIVQTQLPVLMDEQKARNEKLAQQYAEAEKADRRKKAVNSALDKHWSTCPDDYAHYQCDITIEFEGETIRLGV